MKIQLKMHDVWLNTGNADPVPEKFWKDDAIFFIDAKLILKWPPIL